jgi:hypothetical protein
MVMRLASINAQVGTALWLALLLLPSGGCHRSGIKEAPITGKSTDPPVALRATWQPGKRFIYRVESTTSSQVPRKNTGMIIHAGFVLGQDLAFAVTNVAADGSRVLQMELLSVQMETTRDDGMTLAFDSANKVMQVESSPLVDRLRKLVGLKLAFRLSPDGQVTRVEGVKDLNNRMSGSGSIRGLAGSVLNAHFNQQFFRDIVEMGLLPKDPVKVGDSWTVSRQASGGIRGSSVTLDLSYKFRGWQRREGTNCARLDFTGTFKPNTGPRTNPSVVRRIVNAAVPPGGEEGTMTGRTWYDPELALAVETTYEQSITTKSTSVRRLRGTTNAPNASDLAEDQTQPPPPTNAPPPTTAGSNTPPDQVVTSRTTSQQDTSVKLLEVELLEK